MAASDPPSVSKGITFELHAARLPMRVQIYPHDTTESIITTVKNFYGLYTGPTGARGVRFEDDAGHALVAHYDNLRDNMVVHVKVTDEIMAPDATTPAGSPAMSYGYLPPLGSTGHAVQHGASMSRPDSRLSKRSQSPNGGRGRRSQSTVPTNPITTAVAMKPSRSRPGFKSRGSSTHGGSFAENDALNGYSSGDGAAGSVSSRSKSEHLGNTEISLDNIVEGGRRKRAKFESSELPLFAPPQMPPATSNSSVSPARRMDHHRSSFPFSNSSSHNPFRNPHPLHSPQSYNGGFGQPEMFTGPTGGRRTRGAAYPQRHSTGTTPGHGILPTPDPTVGSCMSEEDKDVALQLMRLGDLTNISHGRTSASTLDDAFSGRADAASSTGATSESESEDELPPARRQKTSHEHGPSYDHGEDHLPSQATTDQTMEDDHHDGSFDPSANGMNPRTKSVSSTTGKPRSMASTKKTTKAKGPSSKSKKGLAGPHGRDTESLGSAHSRKASVASMLTDGHQLADDEEDLSSKPRCQRCRKSKKGCDRQRPCQRCKDAGLSADQCISEDEGNGRKGRYGRHMGVPVKKEELPLQEGAQSAPVMTFPPPLLHGVEFSPDKSNKRKR